MFGRSLVDQDVHESNRRLGLKLAFLLNGVPPSPPHRHFAPPSYRFRTKCHHETRFFHFAVAPSFFVFLVCLKDYRRRVKFLASLLLMVSMLNMVTLGIYFFDALFEQLNAVAPHPLTPFAPFYFGSPTF